MQSKNNTREQLELKKSYIDSKNLDDVEHFLSVWRNSSNSINLETSGSTGTKKTIFAEKKFLSESARMTGEFFRFSSQKRALVCLPLSFIAGKMMLIRCLEFNMDAVICEASKPLNFPDKLDIDFAAMTPYQYEKCLSQNPNKLLKIKTILLGGAPITEKLKNRIVATKQEVYHSYGMTETYSHIALKKITAENSPFETLDGVFCRQAEDGTLIINAPNLGVEELKTNDIVRLFNEKQFDFLGRKDFVVNSAGIKLHPEELEKKIAPLLESNNFFFYGLPDETFGEKLVLFIESDKNIKLNQLNSLLTKYEMPKEVHYIPRFSYTDSGKINRVLTAKQISN
jgi:O-succinylbenzoic acid--CoA ligase